MNDASVLFTKKNNRAKLPSILGNLDFISVPALFGRQKTLAISSTRPRLNEKLVKEINRREK
jgi:hypothetical protein